MNLRHTFNKVTLFISLAKLITFCFIMISQSLQNIFINRFHIWYKHVFAKTLRFSRYTFTHV